MGLRWDALVLFFFENQLLLPDHLEVLFGSLSDEVVQLVVVLDVPWVLPRVFMLVFLNVVEVIIHIRSADLAMDV